ncbi:DUF3284 domain-containing protein [Lactobacillus colini]|nr:DUF3284 domain-containing protein [Lactobacillus colini]
MVRLIREYDFNAQDFFDYIEDSLKKEIRKSRNNSQKVVISNGTRYRLYGKDGQQFTDIVINKFERDHIYDATFASLGERLTVRYTVDNLKQGCRITLTETVHSYDPSKHNKLANLFYDFMYHRSAQNELNKLAAGIRKFKTK